MNSIGSFANPSFVIDIYDSHIVMVNKIFWAKIQLIIYINK
nr:MAG TPA: hypothetical protein [Bacteriophage sp.]